jgi:hypothetical protein
MGLITDEMDKCMAQCVESAYDMYHFNRMVRWDGMGWDGMGWVGMGWDGIRFLTSKKSLFFLVLFLLKSKMY